MFETLIEDEDYYWEGAAMVFTARFHLRRGHCCENKCRHCPYLSRKEEGTEHVRENERENSQAHSF